jgi:hypothetical protein
MVTEKDKHPQFAKAITKYITTQMKRPHWSSQFSKDLGHVENAYE